MAWNLSVIRNQIGENSTIVSIHGCGEKGSPQNVPAHYIGLGVEQQLAEANKDSKHYVRVHYKQSGGSAVSFKIIPLQDIYVPYPAMELLQPVHKHFILFTSIGIKQVHFPNGLSIPALDEEMKTLAQDQAEQSVNDINAGKEKDEKPFIPDNDYWKAFMPLINQLVPISPEAYEAGIDFKSSFE